MDWDADARAIAELEAEEFARRVADLDEPDQAEALRLRFRYDLEGFCRYCWPDRFDLPFNAMHRSLFRAAELRPWQQRRATHQVVRDAVAAPRGYAKTTISTFAMLVHAIVYDLEAYIVLLSTDQRLSFALSRDLRNALQASESPLAELYGPFSVSGVVSEWEVAVRGRPSIGVLASSFGGSVRGAKHPTRGIRPTRVVIDDGEHKDRVRNPEQRRIWWDFLTKDVLKLGGRGGGTVYEVRGTILHTDAMLAKLMADPGWTSRRWRAIISWPEHPELWERCGRIWATLTYGEHREAAARAYYAANREQMDAGVEVLDPHAEGIFELYQQIWGEGLASFLQEKQNDPVDPTTAIFHPQSFARCRVITDRRGLVVVHPSGRQVPLKDLRLRARWDPATGTPDGDYAAIAVLGRDRYGYTYVLECWMARAKPSLQLEAAWRIAERWGLRRMSLESNGFQELVVEPFARQRRERQELGQYWQLSILEEPTTENKEGRIASLEPDATNGWLLFSDLVPQEVFLQFAEFPSGAHDDGPDAIQWAWKELGGSPISMGQQRLQ